MLSEAQPLALSEAEWRNRSIWPGTGGRSTLAARFLHCAMLRTAPVGMTDDERVVFSG